MREIFLLFFGSQNVQEICFGSGRVHEVCLQDLFCQNHHPPSRVKWVIPNKGLKVKGKVCMRAKWPIRPELIPVSVG